MARCGVGPADVPAAFFHPRRVGFWCLTTGWLIAAKILPAWQPGAPPGHQGSTPPESGWYPWPGRFPATTGPSAGPSRRATRSEQRRASSSTAVSTSTACRWNEMLPRLGHAPGSARLIAGRSRQPLRCPGPAGHRRRGRLAVLLLGGSLPGTSSRSCSRGPSMTGGARFMWPPVNLRYEVTRHIPTDVMIGDELSPQATMPGLEQGRRWTVPVYSPLRTGHRPSNSCTPRSTGEETFFWDDTLIRVHVVTYREDPIAATAIPAADCWVDRSGRVLRQEAALLGARLDLRPSVRRRGSRSADGESRRRPSAGDESPRLAVSPGGVTAMIEFDHVAADLRPQDRRRRTCRWRSPAANCSPCSAPTAPARRRASRCSSACSSPSRGSDPGLRPRRRRPIRGRPTCTSATCPTSPASTTSSPAVSFSGSSPTCSACPGIWPRAGSTERSSASNSASLPTTWRRAIRSA